MSSLYILAVAILVAKRLCFHFKMCRTVCSVCARVVFCETNTNCIWIQCRNGRLRHWQCKLLYKEITNECKCIKWLIKTVLFFVTRMRWLHFFSTMEYLKKEWDWKGARSNDLETFSIFSITQQILILQRAWSSRCEVSGTTRIPWSVS